MVVPCSLTLVGLNYRFVAFEVEQPTSGGARGGTGSGAGKGTARAAAPQATRISSSTPSGSAGGRTATTAQAGSSGTGAGRGAAHQAARTQQQQQQQSGRSGAAATQAEHAMPSNPSDPRAIKEAAQEIFVSCQGQSGGEKLNEQVLEFSQIPALNVMLRTTAEISAAQTAAQEFRKKLCSLQALIHQALQLGKRTARGKKYDIDKDQLEAHVTEMFESGPYGVVKLFTKLCGGYLSGRVDCVMYETCFNDLIMRKCPLPLAFAVRGQSAQCAHLAMHNNIGAFTELLRTDLSRAEGHPLSRITLDNRHALNRDIVEKSFGKYAPSSGCNALQGGQYMERLLAFCREVSNVPILSVKDNTDLKLITTAFGCGTLLSGEEAASRDKAIEALEKLPEDSLISGTVSSPKFKEALKAVAEKKPGTKKRQTVGMLQARLKKLQEIESAEDFDHDEALQVIREVNILCPTVAGYIATLPQEHASVTAYGTIIASIKQYIECAHKEVDQNTGIILEQLGKRDSGSWDVACEAFQLCKNIEQRAALIVPTASQKAGARCYDDSVAMGDMIDCIRSLRVAAEAAFQYSHHFHGKTTGTPFEEAAFRTVVSDHATLQARFRDYEELADSTSQQLSTLMWKGQFTFFMGSHCVNIQGRQVYEAEVEKMLQAYEELLGMPSDDISQRQASRMLSTENCRLLERLAAWSETPQRDRRAIDLAGHSVRLLCFRHSLDQIANRGDAKSDTEVQHLRSCNDAIVHVTKLSQEDQLTSLQWLIKGNAPATVRDLLTTLVDATMERTEPTDSPWPVIDGLGP